MTSQSKFVRMETQISATGKGLDYRASVYREGTVKTPGEVWMASSGWNTDPNYPLQWLEGVYPELAAEWGARA